MYAVVTVAYVTAFSLLSLALNAGLALGVAYGIWSAAGVALTATASNLLFKEPLALFMGFVIVLIVGGVLMIEFAAKH